MAQVKTMTQVKTFSNTLLSNLDNQINDFIKNHKVIDIKFSSVRTQFNQTEFSALVIYEISDLA